VDGISIGKDKLKRIRKKLGLKCKQLKNFKATTNLKHKLPVAANLLEHNFMTSHPGEVWVADIIYIFQIHQTNQKEKPPSQLKTDSAALFAK
jgi:transposase InsO family protein